MQSQPTHLRQISTGRLFAFTHVLARRSDMRPVNVNANGEETVAQVATETKRNHAIPVDQQEQFLALERQMNDLERRHSQLVDLIQKLTGGKEYLETRDPISAVAPPSETVADTTGLPHAPGVPISSMSPVPGAVTTPGNQAPPVKPPESNQNTDGTTIGGSTITPPANNTLDPKALEQAQARVTAATNKVKSQQSYFDEQTERLATASEQLAEANTALETADDSNLATVQAQVEAAAKEEKAAGIKVKSATTKLENAKKSLDESMDELEKLTTSS